MKKAILSALLLIFVVSLVSFAETTSSPKEMNMEKRKEEVISRIDKRIQMLQELKKCISDAKTREDLKKCRDTFKGERRGLWER